MAAPIKQGFSSQEDNTPDLAFQLMLGRNSNTHFERVFNNAPDIVSAHHSLFHLDRVERLAIQNNNLKANHVV